MSEQNNITSNISAIPEMIQHVAGTSERETASPLQINQSGSEMNTSSSSLINSKNKIIETVSQTNGIATYICNNVHHLCHNALNICNNTALLHNSTEQSNTTQLCNTTTQFCNSALELCNNTLIDSTTHDTISHLSEFEKISLDFFIVWLMYGLLILAFLHKYLFKRIIRKISDLCQTRNEPTSRPENANEESRVSIELKESNGIPEI